MKISVGLVLVAFAAFVEGGEVTEDDKGALRPRTERRLFQKEICVKSGIFGGESTYETIYALPFLGAIHLLLGGKEGNCAELCTELCNHQPCYADYAASRDGNTCDCFEPTASACGTDSTCIDDVCQCDPGFQGNPYKGGCLPDAACAGGVCAAQFGENCPSMSDDACDGPLVCGRRSRSDMTYVCCGDTGICNGGDFQCCNGMYKEGEPCPSKSRNDCDGELLCGKRHQADETFVCCKETYYGELDKENPVCRPF